MVLSEIPRSSSAGSSLPTSPSCSIIPSAYSVRELIPGLSRIDSRTCVRKCMRVVFIQQKKGFASFLLRRRRHIFCGRGFVVDFFHPLFGQPAGVFNRLLADSAPARLLSRIVFVARLAAQHAARTDCLPDRRILRIEMILRIFLRIEVIKVAKKLIEPMHRGKVFIAIAEMVLSELAGRISNWLE